MQYEPSAAPKSNSHWAEYMPSTSSKKQAWAATSLHTEEKNARAERRELVRVHWVMEVTREEQV